MTYSKKKHINAAAFLNFYILLHRDQINLITLTKLFSLFTKKYLFKCCLFRYIACDNQYLNLLTKHWVKSKWVALSPLFFFWSLLLFLLVCSGSNGSPSGSYSSFAGIYVSAPAAIAEVWTGHLSGITGFFGIYRVVRFI